MAEEVHRLSRQFPGHETYGLGGQIQRAVISIPANIAEGHARGSTKDFLRYLVIAQGSPAEVETHLLFVERLHYCDEVQVSPILSKCTQEAKMLRTL